MMYRVLVVLSVAWLVGGQFTCHGPNEECLSIHDCPFISEALSVQPLRIEVIRLLRKQHCGFMGFTPFICCSEDMTLELPPVPIVPVRNEPITSIPDTSAIDNSILPADSCGPDYESNKILNGDVTDIDEFPWMVLLGYRLGNGSIAFECGGFIINHRYILTAAHCVTGTIVRRKGPLEVIRVGEYDLRTDKDCLYGSEKNGCAPPHQDIGVEDIIPHRGFVDGKINREDDIALVRLSKNLEFGFFVQPLCLTDLPPPVPVGEKFYVSGWGRTLTSRKSSVKLKLQVPNFNKTNCDEIYAKANAKLTDKQLCAGGEDEKDTCDGDSGGPLMKLIDDKWYALGIVSFGNGCGKPGWPGIYTSVPKYMKWIKDSMKP